MSDKLQTAVMIMVSNALKATKTAVWIKVNIDSDLTAIQVLNDGEQIEPPDLEKLFKPMTQLDISSTRQFEGIGMGLYTLATNCENPSWNGAFRFNPEAH
jgi:signal transduction histidine kinase